MVSTCSGASVRFSAVPAQSRPSQTRIRPGDSARPSDTVVFGGTRQPEKWTAKLTFKTISLLAPILAVTGCSVPIPGENSEEPEDRSKIPAAPTLDDSIPLPTPEGGTAFFETAMALNGAAAATPSLPPAPEPTAPTVPEPSVPESPPPVPVTPEPTTSVPPPPPPPPPVPETPAPPTPVQPQEKVRVMTQNVWASHWPRARKTWKPRIATVADIIKNNNAELIALQETEPNQFHRLKELLGNEYKSFPGNYENAGGLSQRALVYKAQSADGKPLWELKESDVLRIPDYGDPGLDQLGRAMPWGRFVHAQTGQEVVMTSIHATAWDMKLDSGGALKREEAGKRIAAWARDMKAKFPNAVVVAAGDFNQRDQIRLRPPAPMSSNDNAIDGNRQRMIPCLVGKELRAADDIAANRPGDCPMSEAGIDNAYTNAKDAGNIQHIRRGQSDHAAVLFDLELFKK